MADAYIVGAVRTATGGDPVRAQIVQPGLAEIPLQ